MKLQIDTINKTIKVNEPVNIKELIDFVKITLPESWEEYKIEVDVMYIDRPFYPQPIYPIWLSPTPYTPPFPIITCRNK